MGFFDSIGNVFSGAANAVSNVGSSVGKAVVSPFAGAISSAAPAIGSGISGVLGPGGKNAAAIGAIGGAALGDPLALGSLGASSSAPATPATGPTIISTPAPAAAPGLSTATILIPVAVVGGIGLIFLLMKKKG